jgi:hypothetical protein
MTEERKTIEWYLEEFKRNWAKQKAVMNKLELGLEKAKENLTPEEFTEFKKTVDDLRREMSRTYLGL